MSQQAPTIIAQDAEQASASSSVIETNTGLSPVLQEVEQTIRAYVRSVNATEKWTASRTQMDGLFQQIYTRSGTLSKSDEAPIFYNHNVARGLLHIYLGREDPSQVLSAYAEELRSVIVDIGDAENSTILCNQYDQILYNESGAAFVANNSLTGDKWTQQVEIQESYDGTLIGRFYHQGEWVTFTRRCLDAGTSKWSRKSSHLQMFEQVTAGKIDWDQLDRNLCYYFVLVHEENLHLLPVAQEHRPGAAILVDTRQLRTMIRVRADESNWGEMITTPRAKRIRIDGGLDGLQQRVSTENARMHKDGLFNFEGYVVKVYRDAQRCHLWKVLKFQTELYQTLKTIRPNTGALMEMSIELYNNGKLAEYMKWCGIDKSVKKMIYHSLQDLSREVLQVYRLTRRQANPVIYHSLTGNWREMLFDLHGRYLSGIKVENRGKSPTAKAATPADAKVKDGREGLTEEDVVAYFRQTPARQIVYLFLDRPNIVKKMQDARNNGQIKNLHPFYRTDNLIAMVRALQEENGIEAVQ
jgi:hypothetical protein